MNKNNEFVVDNIMNLYEESKNSKNLDKLLTDLVNNEKNFMSQLTDEQKKLYLNVTKIYENYTDEELREMLMFISENFYLTYK